MSFQNGTGIILEKRTKDGNPSAGKGIDEYAAYRKPEAEKGIDECAVYRKHEAEKGIDECAAYREPENRNRI